VNQTTTGLDQPESPPVVQQPGADCQGSRVGDQRLLECVGLVKDYPGKRAVDGVDFHVMPGEIVGLLGPNGAGKTTTFRMACGMVTPTEGKVYLRDVDVSKWPMYRRARNGMGYLPQDHSIFTRLSVEQNIHAVLEYLPLSKGERNDKVDTLLEQFGLSNKRKQISSTMSGGEKRRLEIARCLATDPVLILLDEPFTGIDPVTIHSIQDIIAGLREQGISILLTDHRERETLTITDRNYIIFQGTVLVSGDAETVLSNPDAQQCYFGERFDASSIIQSRDSFTNGDRDAA
jgi:lipopolysaccharide export system ATP-binding protein